MDYYKGNYAKALVQLFPEVKFNLSKFAIAPRIIIIINLKKEGKEGLIIL